MADCATCSRPLGGQLRRCRSCGACESCCNCAPAGSPDEQLPAFEPFTPAELGLDPEDYDLEQWENAPRRGRNGRVRREDLD